MDTPIGSESTGNGLFFSESSTQNLEWLSIIGITQSDLTTPNRNGYIRVGISIDDDLSCYDARIRFGLALNNQSDVYTLNDTSGFGASAY